MGVTDTGDVFGVLTDVALEASGVPGASSIWKLFFPDGEPEFSRAQLDQMASVFEAVLGQANYEQYLAQYQSLYTLMGEYVNNPSPDLLIQIQTNSIVVADQLALAGCQAIESYLSAISLHILALKFVYETAADPDKPSAAESIGDLGIQALSKLVELEQQLLTSATVTLDGYAHFKLYTSLDELPLDDNLIQYVGASYRDNILKLIGVVQDFAPSTLASIQSPQALLRFFPYDESFVHQFWTGHGDHPIWFYKVGPAPHPGYVPVADVCTTDYTETYELNPQPPALIAFMKNPPGTTKLSTNPTYSEVYNDGGSGNPDNYSGWNMGDGADKVGIAAVSGTGDANYGGDNAPGPNDYMEVDSSLVESVELGSEQWDDSGTGADEDCSVYAHPQFGTYGAYCIYRSHSRPDNDFVSAFTLDALSGHPYFPSAK